MQLFLINYAVHTLILNGITSMEATWLRGQHVGFAVHKSQIHIPLWPLAGLVLGLPEFKSTAMLLISQPVGSCEVGVVILLCSINLDSLFQNYFSEVPVNSWIS